MFRSNWKPNKEEVVATNGVVTAMHPPCAEAGLEILKSGGNAVDAGVAIGFCNTVVEPYMANICGVGCMLIYLAKEGKAVAIDFSGRAPQKAYPDMYRVIGKSPLGSPRVFDVEDDKDFIGPLSVVVPGTCAGLCQAHKLYGKLPLEQVMEPAIRLALEGFEPSWSDTLFIANWIEFFRKDPIYAGMWLNKGDPPSGAPFGFALEGELREDDVRGGAKVAMFRIIQHDLGELLKRIAKQGADALYRGEVADAIDEFMHKKGGLLTKKDLEDYQPTIYDTVSIPFKGYEIKSAARPSMATSALETFRVLDNFDLKGLGHNSVEYLHVLIEALRHAFADLFRYIGDPDYVPVPFKGLLSQKYAQELARQVDMSKTMAEPDGDPWSFYLEHALHDPWKYDPSPYSGKHYEAAAPRGRGTTHFNVVDKDRNIVTCTHTGGISPGAIPPGTGAYLSGSMLFFVAKPGYANSIAGWKRTAGGCPLMVFKDGRPILCQGAPGGRPIMPRGVQVVSNILIFGMTPQEAIAQPTVDASRETVLDSRIPSDICTKLERLGHHLRVVEEEPGGLGHFARPSAIYIDYDAGVIRAGVDVFRPAMALGY